MLSAMESDQAWHAGLIFAYLVLVGSAIGGIVLIRRIKACFLPRVYKLRVSLLVALVCLGTVRAAQMLLGLIALLTGDRLTPTHVSDLQLFIAILFVLGYWIFFCANCVVTVVWLHACSRTRKKRIHRFRILFLTGIAVLLGIAFMVVVGLYRTALDIAFESMNWIICVSSIVAALGFSVAAVALNISLRGVQWRSQLSRAARRAQRVAATLACISISSFIARAGLNATYWFQGDLFIHRGGTETAFHILDYTATELFPGLSLTGYLVFTSLEQRSQMSEFSSSGIHAPIMAGSNLERSGRGKAHGISRWTGGTVGGKEVMSPGGDDSMYVGAQSRSIMVDFSSGSSVSKTSNTTTQDRTMLASSVESAVAGSAGSGFFRGRISNLLGSSFGSSDQQPTPPQPSAMAGFRPNVVNSSHSNRSVEGEGVELSYTGGDSSRRLQLLEDGNTDE